MKVLRHPGLIRRAQTLPLYALLNPLVRQQPQISPAVWVIAAARELAGRCGPPVPARWLAKLAGAFDLGARAASPQTKYSVAEKPDPPYPPLLRGGEKIRRAVSVLPPLTRGGRGGNETASKLPDFETLPPAAWNEPSLLGEVLMAARLVAAEARARNRLGRAGRVSSGGVYTPAAVARRIVAEVPAAARRVVDPACGAGVFLLEAFQRAYLRRLAGGAPPLSAAQAALSQELTGIDLDPQALAVAEFSLRLEGLRRAGLDRDVPLDLRLADALEKLDGLEGNCECLVGNPPFIEGRGLDEAQLKKFRARFRCAAKGKVNLCAIFIERALELLKEDGVLALVVPATFQRNARYRNLREVLLEHSLEAILPLERACFGQHIVETVVLRVRKKPPRRDSRVQLAGGETLQISLPLGPGLRFCARLTESQRRQIESLERRGAPLGDYFEVRDGISTGFQPFPRALLGVFAPDPAPAGSFVSLAGVRRPFDPRLHRKIIDGGEFSAFTPVQWTGRYIEYDKQHEHDPPHPGRPFNCQLRSAAIYDRPEKLLTRQTARGLIATVDRQRYFVRNSVHVTFVKSQLPLSGQSSAAFSLDALCACFNSRLYNRYLLAVTGESGDVFPQVHIADLKRLPILPGLLQSGGPLARLGAQLLKLHEAPEQHAPGIAGLKAEAEELLCAAFGVEENGSPES